MSRKRRILDHYDHRIQPGRASFDVLDWSDRDSQLKRFAVLPANVELDGKTLLDVGCGLGDLWAFLNAHDISVEYVGVDLSEKMVCAARRLHPDAEFVSGDVFKDEVFPPGAFDVVFASGVFNLDLGNNREFLARAVRRLLDLAGECVVFNLLHTRADVCHEGYVYYDPAEVLKDLEALSCHVTVVDDYLDGDFTLICRKVDAG